MDSPSTPERTSAPDGESAPLPGTVQVAAGLHARRVPLLSTPRVRALSGIGDVGRAARRFSALTGLSLSARMAMHDQRSTVHRMPVRPPDYWTGFAEEEEVRVAAARQTTGDAALDALIAKRGSAKRVARKAQHVQVQRGLPSTIHRRTNSIAGPMTAPGGMARRLQPAAMVPVPNPANSPQTAASREPRSPSPAAKPGADRAGRRDRPRPTAPPSNPTRRTTRPGSVPADAVAEVRRTATSDTPRSPLEVAASATSAADAALRRATSPAAGEAPSSSAPVLGPETDSGTVGFGTENDAVAVDQAEGEAPAWPGDLPEEPAAAATPFAPGTVGRRVAVQPLLAGWRAPTAWRSIAAGDGLRLLPVHASGLPSSWSSPAAASAGDSNGGSWADTVRRAAEAANGPGAVRNLPVGGPSVIVRDGASSAEATGARATTVRRSPATTSGTPDAPAASATSSAPSSATRSANPVPEPTAAPSVSGPRTVAAGRAGSVAASSSSAAVRRATAPGDTWVPAAAAMSSSSASPSSTPVGRTAASSPVVLRRHVASTPAGGSVEVTAWSLPPGFAAPSRGSSARPAPFAAAAPSIRRAPGFRPDAARRPGGWMGRAAARVAGTFSGLVQRVPMGPLGPVRWSTRADEPVVARSTSASGSSWAATVAAASAAMAGGGPVVGSTANLPVAGGLTLIRGGRADGSDLPAAAVQRTGVHPAAARLRLVPPVDAGGGASTSTPTVQRAVAATTPTSTAAPATAAPADAAAAWVGRAPTGASPFVSVPGAVAAHGLPAARASLVGVTASGAGVGPAAPGALGRLAHGQPVRRRASLDLAPPAVVLRSASPEVATSRAPAHADRPGLPATPAAVVRRRQAEAHTASSWSPAGSLGATSSSSGSPAGSLGATSSSSGSLGATSSSSSSWAQRVAAATGSAGSPAALAALMAASPSAPTLVQRTVTSATSTPAARLTWPTRSNGTGNQQAALAPQAGAAPTWRERVAAAAEGRALPDVQAKASSTPPAPGSLVSAPVYATGGAPVASLRGLPVAPAAFGLVQQGAAPAAGTTSSTVARSTGAVERPTSSHGPRSRAAHGVSATVVRRSRDHRPGVVADRWRAVDVPARALPGRGPSALRPIGAPVPANRDVIERTPMRPDAPGAAKRFDEVLRRSEEKVRTQALPVRFRPLADRIVGRMPVQIATGAASQRALAAVGTGAATTGSVIHLSAAPDSSARTASLIAHELTHVAAASPVARFHGGAHTAEEVRATQVERIVARAARTGTAGRGPSSPGTAGLPVGGPVAVRGASAGPPVPASAASPTPSVSGGGMSADVLARSIEGGGSGGGAGGQTIQRSAAPTSGEGAAPQGATTRIVRRREAPVESAPEVAEKGFVLDDEAMDKIVRALEARLLESIERRGGMWRGGF
jgi:hypothetical protein